MKGKSMVALIVAIVLVAIGATVFFITQFFENNPTQPGSTSYFTGIIVDMDDNGAILVVGDLPIEEAKNLSVQEAIDAGKDATRFSVTMDQRNALKLYDEVRVGYGALDESYPMQGSAKTVEKLNK